MEYIVISFRSRQDTIAFSRYLYSGGVPCEIVNTPKEAHVGCGLSVKTQKQYLNVCRVAVYNAKFKSFAGIFLVVHQNGNRIVKSI